MLGYGIGQQKDAVTVAFSRIFRQGRHCICLTRWHISRTSLPSYASKAVRVP